MIVKHTEQSSGLPMRTTILRGIWLSLILFLSTGAVYAAPYAAVVIDARTGEVLHARNADTKLHPASLTKMMTLYIAFEAVERGEISLDTKVTISRLAASEPPSRLGLKSGQKIAFRHLIRAAAVKSANDAATAIGEAVSGSEKAFAQRMTATAKAMGLTKTTFKNAHGLTQSGHLSTARDMAILGRRLFYDHRDYYNLFSRIATPAGKRTVYNTNSRFLQSYRGADGIKTGFTRAAGYNLVGSAARGRTRIIASLFGGKSVNWRNGRMRELLDMGFARAPRDAPIVKPEPLPSPNTMVAMAAGRTNKKPLETGIKMAMRPLPRRREGEGSGEVEALVARAVIDGEIDAAILATVATAAAREKNPNQWSAIRPPSRPGAAVKVAMGSPAREEATRAAPQPSRNVQVTAKDTGDDGWSVHLGSYVSRMDAERLLLVTALQDLSALDGAYRKIDSAVEEGRTVYRARFVGLSARAAERACARLQARSAMCKPISPGT